MTHDMLPAYPDAVVTVRMVFTCPEVVVVWQHTVWTESAVGATVVWGAEPVINVELKLAFPDASLSTMVEAVALDVDCIQDGVALPLPTKR